MAALARLKASSIVDEHTETLKQKYGVFHDGRIKLMDRYNTVWDRDTYEDGFYNMKREEDD